VTPRVQVLTAIAIPADDPRYLSATLQNTTIVIAPDGRTARVSGQVSLPADSPPAKVVWVAAVAYDAAGRVVGFRRWEGTGVGAFDLTVASLGSRVKRVEVFVEARP
jgi:hypothetical protein